MLLIRAKSISKSLLLIACLGLVMSCEKEEIPEGPTRFLEPVYENVVKQTVVYSDVTGLEMDIYTPEGDDSQNRPVVFIGHGGGFYFGSKENPAVIRMAEDFAKLGYVAVGFNYQLASGLGDILDSNLAVGLVLKSIGDGRAAVRYMRKTFAMGNPYGINPTKFFMGGNSAGGVLAMHVGFFDKNDQLRPFFDSVLTATGGFEGSGGNPGYSSEVQGVFNLAGGIVDIKLIDADDPPVYNAHGLEDDVVPIDCGDVYQGLVSGDVIDLCGSIPIHDEVQKIGGSSILTTYPGKHVPWLDQTTGEPVSPMFDQIEDDVIQFLYNNL